MRKKSNFIIVRVKKLTLNPAPVRGTVRVRGRITGKLHLGGVK